MHDSFLRPFGPVAAAQRTIFLEITAWMMIVVLPVLVLVPLFAWRYRRGRNRAAWRPDWQFSRRLEWLVWGVPVLVVAAMAIGVGSRAARFDPYAAQPGAGPPLEIDVVALDWKFLFLYPAEGVASAGQLVLPVGRPVRLRLTSDSVMQSLLIPALGSQIYAMAGMVTQLNLVADRAGRMTGRNTQYSGDGFHAERFAVRALPQAGFRAWIAALRHDGVALDAARYRVLASRGTLDEAHRRLATPAMPADALWFNAVPPDRFARVVARYRPPVAGQRAGGRP